MRHFASKEWWYKSVLEPNFQVSSTPLSTSCWIKKWILNDLNVFYFISEFIVRKDRKEGRKGGDRNENHFEKWFSPFLLWNRINDLSMTHPVLVLYFNIQSED